MVMTLSPSTSAMTSLWDCFRTFLKRRNATRIQTVQLLQTKEEIETDGLKIKIPTEPSYSLCRWCKNYYTSRIVPKDCRCNKSLTDSK